MSTPMISRIRTRSDSSIWADRATQQTSLHDTKIKASSTPTDIIEAKPSTTTDKHTKTARTSGGNLLPQRPQLEGVRVLKSEDMAADDRAATSSPYYSRGLTNCGVVSDGAPVVGGARQIGMHISTALKTPLHKPIVGERIEKITATRVLRSGSVMEADSHVTAPRTMDHDSSLRILEFLGRFTRGHARHDSAEDAERLRRATQGGTQ
ncbi:hypothetical protein HOY80DRAFT_998259 [Tuber brumale]|nr:hypothetical protein HOY80DRAFT_998259 [Tuber brumale]